MNCHEHPGLNSKATVELYNISKSEASLRRKTEKRLEEKRALKEAEKLLKAKAKEKERAEKEKESARKA